MDNSAYDDIGVEILDDVCLILLDAPERKNSFTVRMGRELVHALDRSDADDAVRAVVISANGPTFCVGGDLNQRDGAAFRRKPSDGPKPPFRDPGGPVSLRMYESPKPIVVGLNGSAVGIGLSMTLAADMRIGAAGAKFGFPFAARGITPDATSSWFLPRLVGLGRALEWCVSGRIFGADEALAAGLIGGIHPADRILSEAVELARSIGRTTAPVAVALTRQLLLRMAGAPTPHDAHRIESMALEYTGASPDTVEGVTAFMERRAPRWGQSVPADLPPWFPWWPADMADSHERRV